MHPNTNTSTGAQAGNDTKDYQDALLREMVAAESDPANESHIKEIFANMRFKMNQVLAASGIKSTLGQPFLHNPGGNNIVEVRENLTAKEFADAVNFVNDDAQGFISAQSRKQLFDILNNGLAKTRVAKPVTIAEEVGEAVRKSDEADKAKEQQKAHAPKAWYNPKRWWNWIKGVNDEKKWVSKENGVKAAKWTWGNFITHMDVFDDFWQKNPSNYKKK